MIWIGYTTTYREGGPKFQRAATTLATAKRASSKHQTVICESVNSKTAFLAAMRRIEQSDQTIDELHFIGHSGMYGIMFRTAAMPEQFSPHEWRNLKIPFAENANAYFHACRTARWFAPFFARTFGVRAHGYHWYTTISAAPDRFVWEGPWDRPTLPLYVIACPGRKSHGVLGSLLKYSRFVKAEPLKSFTPTEPEGDTSYDSIARLYAQAFEDIRVRGDEVRWIAAHLPTSTPRVLDIGCGTGGLLRELSPRIGPSVGVDVSTAMLAEARSANVHSSKMSFQPITGPSLPFDDASFDVVVSLLSFRYLDWDPILAEIKRVLAPGGKLLIVDMVTVPMRLRELGRYASSKLRHTSNILRRPLFRRALRQLVNDPRWHTMLRHNPIRSDHEFRWYLESRFPGRQVELLNLGWNTRILAFDTGPVDAGHVNPQTYP
jgi:ubiquinone/menaquinone biosynthesis C-methylase UbiE